MPPIRDHLLRFQNGDDLSGDIKALNSALQNIAHTSGAVRAAVFNRVVLEFWEQACQEVLDSDWYQESARTREDTKEVAMMLVEQNSRNYRADLMVHICQLGSKSPLYQAMLRDGKVEI